MLNHCKIISSFTANVSVWETLRGGVLILVRWFVIYPWVYILYNIKDLQKSPWRLNPEDRGRIDEPGILVTNHWNGIFDFLIAQIASPRWASFLVDMRFTRIPGTRFFFRILRGCPILRKRPSRTQQLSIYESLARRLLQGGWVCLFPEGPSMDRSSLGPLKPGMARLALLAEEKAGWGLQLKIYVLGLNYENAAVGRSNVYAKWGRVLKVADYRELFLKSPQDAELAIKNDVSEALRNVVIQADSIQKLEEAHQVAFLENDQSWQGVKRAVVSKAPAARQGIQESVIYKNFVLFLFSVFAILSWPFRVFGKLCAKNPSEEAGYIMLIWALVLVVGVERSGIRWLTVQLLVTWFCSVTWLWAWRRGVPQAK